MNKKQYLVSMLSMSAILAFFTGLKPANAQVGDIFEPIYSLFEGLFQGALPLIFLLFIIVIVIAKFGMPGWLKKIFGWSS